jgi:2-methylisocitrate lyase-like PEP mutase family enzyme
MTAGRGMIKTDSSAQQLRTLLARPELLRAPGVFEGIGAHLARHAGFEAVYMTGAGVAASGFGLPDIGLVTQTEMLERLRMIVEATGLPVIADADTGYGNALHVARTVRAYERAGAAALHLEDQAFPKRCGHLANKELIDTDEYLAKLAAALDARNELVIIARTDARGPRGLEEALDRAHRYAEAGADMIFVEAPESTAEIARIAAEIDVPLVFNVVPGGKSPAIAESELSRLGFALAIYPGVLLSAVANGLALALSDMSGVQLDAMNSPLALFEAVGIRDWLALDRRFSVA